MRREFNRFVAAGATVLALVPGSVWAQASSDAERWAYGPHMMWWGGGLAMIFGPLFMILFLIVIVAAVALAVRWAGGSWQTPAPWHHVAPPRTALDILKERYARGEIDKEEFEERRRVLGE
jgi:putative membrane protein